MPYDGDSFFTLSAAGQVGLVLLSLSLALVTGALIWRWPHPALAFPAFWLFVWLSPQVYYLYYQAIIDGLPWQIVVRAPPGPGHIARLLAFAERPTLSAHAQGALGWGLLAVAFLRRVMRRRRRRTGGDGDEARSRDPDVRLRP